MPAIVKNDEDPDKECPGQDRQWHREPPGYRKTDIHQVPEGCVGHDAVNDLPNAATHRRILIARDNLFPRGFILPGTAGRWRILLPSGRNWVIGHKVLTRQSNLLGNNVMASMP